MKKKILIFISGIVVGVIISTIGFFIYGKTIDKNPRERMPMDQNGEFEPSKNMRERPEFTNEVFEEKMIDDTNTVN